MWMRHYLFQKIQRKSDEKPDAGKKEILSGASGLNGIFRLVE